MENILKIVGKKRRLNTEDKIGQLNEDIMGVIISYLTFKEARRSSVLSRRWKNMWTLTTRFSFDASKTMDQLKHSINQDGYKDAIERERREYIRLVNEYVDNHRGTCLDEFVVVFQLDARHSLHLDKWIRFAVKKRAKAIKIDLRRCFVEEGGNVKYSLMKNVVVLPGIECLSSLNLSYVNVSGETIEHLLSVCPLLERLRLSYIDSKEKPLNLRVVGSSLRLKYLYIYLDHRFASVEIRAPNLVSLAYLVSSAARVRLEGLCCLRDLGVCFISLNDEFFRYFRQLETISLVFLSRSRGVFAPPQLINLKHLTVIIYYFRECDMFGLTNFINFCPLLRKFTLNMWFQVDRLPDEEPEIPALPWGNLHPQEDLKELEIIGFIGHRCPIEITKYFLEALTVWRN